MAIKKLLKNEKVRFVIVGCFNTALDFLLLNFFTFALGINSLVANVMAVLICIVISYILNHHFVFQKKEKLSFIPFLTFFAVTGFSAVVLQTAIIGGLQFVFDWPFSRSILMIVEAQDNVAFKLNIAKCAAVGVGMIWNFVFYKRVVFRKKSSGSDAEFVG